MSPLSSLTKSCATSILLGEKKKSLTPQNDLLLCSHENDFCGEEGIGNYSETAFLAKDVIGSSKLRLFSFILVVKQKEEKREEKDVGSGKR